MILRSILVLLLGTIVTSSFLSEELLAQVEDQLSNSCGDRCLGVFHDLLPLITNMTSMNETAGLHQEIQALNAFMRKYVSTGHEENERLLNELEQITVSSFASNPVSPPDVGSLRKHIPPAVPGIPCATQAECDSLDFKMNRCSHLRKASMVAYVGANTVLSVMANLITVSCGCIFAGPANVCVLRGVPYVCVFPFYAYNGIYGLSQALYNAVTKITAVCNTGGPTLAVVVPMMLLVRIYLCSVMLGAKTPPKAPSSNASPAKPAGTSPGGALVPGSTSEEKGELLDETDSQPSVEIRLSPPRHPLPEVSSKIEVLDQARRTAEERQTAKLLKAYDEELVRSRKHITALIRKAFEAFDDPAVIPPKLGVSSFFDIGDMRERPGRIWVSVEAAAPIDGAVIKRIDSIEKKNMKSEFLTYQRAVDDMHEVTRMTLQQLNESLVNIMHPVINTYVEPPRNSAPKTRPAFIDLSPAFERCKELQTEFGTELVPSCSFKEKTTKLTDKKENHEHQISVFADEHTYPTIESLVQDMLKRREVDEELFRHRSLALMARLAQEQSKIAEELLQAAVASITVQYAKVIRTTNMTKDELRQYDIDHPKELRKTFKRSPQSLR